MKKKLICSIVILSYNQLDYTKNCLNSIRLYTEDVNYEIIVVDNNSDAETLKYLGELNDITLISNKENKGFAEGCNQGIKIAKGDYIVLLNNDTIVTYKWLSNMLNVFSEDKNVSIVGPLTNSTVGKQMIKVSYGTDIVEMQKFARKIADSDTKPWETLRLVAFCVVVKKEIFEEVGYFDTRFKIGNYEDDDFNIRCLLAGKQLRICRNAFIHHFMNISFHKNNLPRELIMFENKTKLEEKWNYLNWNYYASFNQEMIDDIILHKPNKILHLGCGVGSLGIEIKDQLTECTIYGVETHSIRAEIAKSFYDKIHFYEEEKNLIRFIENNKFDIIIIENFIEIIGVDFFKHINKYLSDNGIIYLRVFNNKHITSIEKELYGEVEGGLICASSDEFNYRYDDNIEEKLEVMGYQIIEKKEIVKTFSTKQEKIYNDIIYNGNNPGTNQTKIYNYIYQLKIKGNK